MRLEKEEHREENDVIHQTPGGPGAPPLKHLNS